MKNFLLYCLLLVMMCSFEGYSQTIVTGSIKDSNGETLPGVSVMAKGTSVGVTSNSSGNYSITVPKESSILIFSFLGMRTQEVELSGRNVVNVILTDNVESLKEVVVVGYGTQTRDVVTTSVSKLDNRVLENVTYANPAAALQGNIAGLRVQVGSGQPGQRPVIVLRGGTSINNPSGSSPLFVIDGVIREHMDDVNSDDIETLQVLKDASAAIYGARGSNGVIIITTKSGIVGKSQVNYNYTLTASNMTQQWDLMNARDFLYNQRLGIQLATKYYPGYSGWLTSQTPAGISNNLSNTSYYSTQYLTPANQYKLSEGWESMPDPIDPSKTIIYSSTNFQDLVYQTGISNDHVISASGGTDKAKFFTSVGYNFTDGITKKTNYKRLSMTLSGDFKLTDNLSVYGKLMYANAGNNSLTDLFPTEAWVFQRYVAVPPVTKYKFEDGTLAPGPGMSMGNPDYWLNSFNIKNVNDNSTMMVGSRWKILPGLSFDPTVSLNIITADRRRFDISALELTSFAGTGRRSTTSHASRVQKQAEALFTYTKSFNNSHNIEAKGGFSYLEFGNNFFQAIGQRAATDLIPTLNASSEMVSITSTETLNRVGGYVSRFNYDFNQKYLVSLNARYDAASNLGNKNKWGFFPGISVGWNLHKEKFWSKLPANLLEFKLRGSYGTAGNISGLGPYQAQGAYSVDNRYFGASGVINTVLPNNDLKWEQSTTLDIGMDVGVFNNRLRLMLDVYRRVTDNLLTGLSLPGTTGFSSILTNYGSLENRGTELEIAADIMPSSKPLQWSVALNVANVKNKILQLPENGNENNRVGGILVWDPKQGKYTYKFGLEEGGTLGEMYAYKFEGVYATDAEAAAGPKDMLVVGTDKTKYGGDSKWADIDGNGLIDSRDRVYMGNSLPKWTGGFSNFFNYKNLGLSIRMDYALGHTMYNDAKRFMMDSASGSNNLHNDILRQWRKQGDVTDIPRYMFTDYSFANVNRGSSWLYSSGDYLMLREVTLSYNLPKQLLQRAKISNIKVHATGNNLYRFTKYEGMNPEIGGYDGGGYQIPRNIIFGVKVTL